MGGIYHRFEVGTKGAAGAHVHYITRAPATQGSETALFLHNYPEQIRGTNYDESRARVVAFNQGAERDEIGRKRRGGGETRTHYKVKLSFEGKVSTDQAREMAAEYLERNFPKGVAVAAVHQDTDHTHVHINMLARQTDGKKVQLKNRDYKKLDEAWAAVYGERFGREKEVEHLRKKEETRNWRRDYARGVRGVPKPERADRGLTKEDFRRRDLRNHDQARAGGYERAVAGGERAAAPPIGSVERTSAARDGSPADIERASAKLRDTIELAQRLGEEIERRGREDRGVERGGR